MLLTNILKFIVPDIIAGYRNGYFSPSEEEEIAQQIADSGTQMLFVAISSPIKENFLYKYRDILKNVNLIMGVGGSFDVVAGKTKRAPAWMQKCRFGMVLSLCPRTKAHVETLFGWKFEIYLFSSQRKIF